jgi:hypothetical protein
MEEVGRHRSQSRGVYPVSEITQHVPNVKCSPGDRHQQPALNVDLLKRVLSPANLHAAWKQAG